MFALSVFIFHFLVNQFQILVNKKVVYYFLGITVVVVFLYFATQITYTADYDMYYSFYDWSYDKTDFLFRNLIDIYRDNSWGFHSLYQTHIIAITLLFCFFISRFSSNFFYILLIFVALIFTPYINQIRYYFAFPCFLLASYYLLYNRKLILFFLFAVLGVLSHSAITLLYVYFLFYLFTPEKYYAPILKFGTVILFVLSYLISTTGLMEVFEHFGEYMKDENQSSVLGGVFNILPTLTLLIPLYILDRKYKGDRTDKMYIFLKKTSFFTVILIPASIFMQILGQRYVLPFLVVWLIFFLYLIRDQKFGTKTNYLIASYFVVLIALILQYTFAEMVFGESFYYEENKQTLESIINYR